MSFQSSGNPLFLNTVLLGGDPRQKIAAARAAGFDQVELWGQDLDSCEIDPEGFGNWVREQTIALTDYQVLRDFDGAPDDARQAKRAEALSMLDMAAKLGASTLLTTASSDCRCLAHRMDEDMQWLAREAALRHLRIAYEGLAWSKVNYALKDAWELVQRVDEPNLGIVIDTFHIFARHRDARDMAGIPIDRVFFVQLSDINRDQVINPEDDRYRENVLHVARHHRRLPGHGQLPIETILRPLRDANYSGPVGVEVFNDAMKARDPQAVAQEAFSALKKVWLR